MQILAISDLHGKLPDTSLWGFCDLVIIAGDSFPDYNLPLEQNVEKQKEFILKKFNPWLKTISKNCKEPDIVLCGGNHCHVLDLNEEWAKGHLNCDYVSFGIYNAFGKKIFYSSYSYSPPHYPRRWSFGQTEDGLMELYKCIPNDIDILVSHTPPQGVLDIGWSGEQMKNFGSIALRKCLDNNMWPKLQLLVAGHIHENGGQKVFYRAGRGDTGYWIANVAACENDSFSNPKQKPMYFEF